MAEDKITKEQAKHLVAVDAQKRFLEAYAQHGTIRAAAQAAQIPYNQHGVWLERDVDYAARWEEAKNIIADLAEEEALRRGITGWDEPVIRQVTRGEGETAISTWEAVGFIRRHSDRMLELILKALRPEKYRERVEHSGRVGLSLEDAMVRGHEQARRVNGKPTPELGS